MTCYSSSCNKQPTKVVLPLEAFVTDFSHENPNYNNNELTRNIGDSIFKCKFIATLDTINLLDDIPMTLIRVSKNSGKYMAHFSADLKSLDYNKYRNTNALRFLHLDVVTEISKEEVEFLKESKNYYIHPKFISTIPTIKLFTYILGDKTLVWSNEFSYSNGDINLGMMLVDSDSIKQL